MGGLAALQAPELGELEQARLEGEIGELTGVLLIGGGAGAGSAAVRPGGGVRIRESERYAVTWDPGSAPGLTLVDAILRDCGLSNVDGREGLMTRVEIHRSQLVGFGFGRGEIRDLRVLDSSLEFASFAAATLRNVVFERVKLAEASFMDARLEAVAFIDCRLAGADFRRAKVTDCAVRGASLDGVLGIEALRGLRMPWPDVLGSAGALAAALGITVETFE